MTATPASYFDVMWGGSEDPWDHGGRWYETRKYDLTIATLQQGRYRRAFEPGCGTGLLTQRLARRCDEVLAADRHERAVLTTRRRVAGANVVVERRDIGESWPSGNFDLVVLSEVLYYFPAAVVGTVIERATTSLTPGGEMVAVHYRRPVADHALVGDDVHALLQAAPDLECSSTYWETEFVLEGFRRR